MFLKITRSIIFLALSVILSACSSIKNTIFSENMPLRVGISSHYHPMVFKEQGELKGLEIDFATSLAQALDRPSIFKEYNGNEIFNALDTGEIDIIKSGVSITEDREKLFRFSQPYTQIAQMAIIRSQDVQQLSPPEALHSGGYTVGFSLGTTGERYVKRHNTGRSIGFKTNAEGIASLKQGTIDYFVHDAPTVWNLANHPTAKDSVDLLGLYHPLTQESLAWMLQLNALQLQEDVNEVLTRWRVNGYLTKTINKWIPVRVQVGQ